MDLSSHQHRHFLSKGGRMKKTMFLVIPMLLCNTEVSSKERFERERQAVLNAMTVANGNAVVSVGIDSDCDFQIGSSTLQDAINSGALEVRIATNASYDPISISGNGSSLNLIGGYGDCQDANNDVRTTQKSIITGSAGMVGVDIDGVNVNMSGLQIQQADDGLLFDSTAGIEVVLDNVEINNNGAGIRINAAQVEIFSEDIRIHHNSALNGSGINCNSNSNIVIVGNSSIDNNQAAVGAGAYLLGGCSLTMVGGDNANANAGISMNIADQIGGGIAVVSASRFTGIGGLAAFDGITYGNLNEPLIISSNQTLMGASVGGGVFAEGVDVEVELMNTAILLNTARNGGGIYANNEANITFSRSAQKCWSDNGCNYLGLNGASLAGGGLYLAGAANLSLTCLLYTSDAADE